MFDFPTLKNYFTFTYFIFKFKTNLKAQIAKENLSTFLTEHFPQRSQTAAHQYKLSCHKTCDRKHWRLAQSLVVCEFTWLNTCCSRASEPGRVCWARRISAGLWRGERLLDETASARTASPAVCRDRSSSLTHTARIWLNKYKYRFRKSICIYIRGVTKHDVSMHRFMFLQFNYIGR